MWAIHNVLRNWTLYSLNEREVQLIMNSLSAHELKLVSLCHLTEKKWQPFDPTVHAQFISTTGKVRNHFPEPLIQAEPVEQTEYFVIRPRKVILPRLHERIDIELESVIEGLSQRQEFKSRTIDLSEGGIHFKDLIPDWISGYFIVNLKYQNEVYQIMCALVEDQKQKHRVQVMSEENDTHYVRYKALLEVLRNIN